VPPTEGPLSIQLFNSQGPMARRVEDLRLAFAAMVAPSPRDPWHTPAPAFGEPARGPVRVGLALPDDTDAAIAEGVQRAARALSAAGYELTDEPPPDLDQAATLWVELLNEDVRRFWPAVEPIVSAGARRFTQGALGGTEPLDVEGYAMRWQARQALARRWSTHQAERPLILAPVSLHQPFGAGEDVRDADGAVQILGALRIVVAVNLLGLPAVAVPVGLDDRGMPLGVQIIGPRFREDLCLDAAAAVEAAVAPVTPIDPRR
jgi:amidase